MQGLKIKLLFESSPWLVFACAVLAFVYAYFLYQKKAPWGKSANLLLSIVRGILSFILALLLLNFFIRNTENKIQKRVIGIVFDNSKSVNVIGPANINSLKQGLNNLKTSLLEKDIDVEIGTFSNESTIDSIQFNQGSTNLGKLLANFKSKNEGRNITDLILVSDGINNQGISPANTNLAYPIYTLGIGDTIRKKDIILKNIIANNIAYKGNEFVVQAEIFSYGLVGKTSQVSISQDNKVISSKNIVFNYYAESTHIKNKEKSNKIEENK